MPRTLGIILMGGGIVFICFVYLMASLTGHSGFDIHPLVTPIGGTLFILGLALFLTGHNR